MTTYVDHGPNPSATLTELRRIAVAQSLDPSVITVTRRSGNLQFGAPDAVAAAFNLDTALTRAAALDGLDTVGELAVNALEPEVSTLKMCTIGGVDFEVPSGGIYLPFQHQGGSTTIFDFTDPLHPTTVQAGLLNLSGYFQTDNNTEGEMDKWIFSQLDIDADGEDPFTCDTVIFPPSGLRGGEQSISMQAYSPAGGKLSLYANHDATGTARCRWTWEATFTHLSTNPRL